jgi:hypothetical protein
VTRVAPLFIFALACGDDRIDATKAAASIKAGLAAHDDVQLAALTCPSHPY